MESKNVSCIIGRSLRVYVGGAIKHAPPEFANLLRDVKWMLSEYGFVVLDFVLDLKATPEFVFTNDIENGVGTCDFMLAICDHSSTGLGSEFASALHSRKPVLAVCQGDPETIITRVILGHRKQFPPPQLQFMSYSNPHEIAYSLVPEFVESVWASGEPTF